MSGKDGSGRRGVGRLVVALLFVAACACYLALVATGRVEGWGQLLRDRDASQADAAASSADVPGDVASSSTGGEDEAGEPTPKAFADYSWEELARISDLVEAAGADGAGEVARRYGLEDADGTLTSETRQVTLADGTVAEARLVGILADTRAEDGTPVGLTFRLATLGMRPMSSAGTSDGGWEASELRAWLAGEGMALLPEDLGPLVVPVRKLTNNVGVASDASAVTETVDSLWLFSAKEVCGDVDWFWHEFRDRQNTGGYAYLDDLVNLEGGQYQAFAEAGVSSREPGDGILAASWGGSPCAWWYRTPYPFDYAGTGERYFFQVMPSGYPDSLGRPDEAAGVVCGFCL